MIEDTYKEMPIIDREQFDMLVETGEDEAAEMLQELLDLFIEDTGPKLQKLQDIVVSGDKAQIAKLAHAIAGSSGNLGGLRLSTASRSLEANIGQATEASMAEAVRVIRELYKVTVDVYSEEIAKI